MPPAEGGGMEISMINLNNYNCNKLNHVIYYEWYLDIRAEDQRVLANLLDRLNRIENNTNPMIFFDTFAKQPHCA